MGYSFNTVLFIKYCFAHFVLTQLDKAHAILVKDDKIVIVGAQKAHAWRLPQLVVGVLVFNCRTLFVDNHDCKGVLIDHLKAQNYIVILLKLLIIT
jgi:hypothetical protein